MTTKAIKCCVCGKELRPGDQITWKSKHPVTPGARVLENDAKEVRHIHCKPKDQEKNPCVH